LRPTVIGLREHRSDNAEFAHHYHGVGISWIEGTERAPAFGTDLILRAAAPVSGELIRGTILPASRAARGRCLSLFERKW
jgi:hypothetical protein